MPQVDKVLSRKQLKARLTGIGTLAGLVVVLAVVLWLWNANKPLKGAQLPEDNGYEATITALLHQPLPKEPIDQVYYYGQLGLNYDALQRYDKALEYYQKGQSVIDSRNLDAQASYLEAISYDFEKLGNKDQAKTYRTKAQERLKRYDAAEPQEGKE